MRTGSTLLCSLLKSTNYLGNPAEYFNRPISFDRFNRQWGTLDLPAYFSRFEIESRTENGVYSSKGSIEGFEWANSYLNFKDTKFIHLVRHDKVYQAISWYKARRSGQWHSKDKIHKVASFDREAILEKANEFKRADIRDLDYFSEQETKVVRLVYEDIQNDFLGTVQTISNFLGFDVTVEKVETNLRITRDEMSEEWYKQIGTYLFTDC